jgi:uncharacterized membrane protein
MPTAIRILYVGDSWMTAGTLGAFSSLTYDLRGASVENQAQHVIDHWRANPLFNVDYMTGWDALSHFPETDEAIQKYDIIFLSDVESDALVLYPTDRSMRAPMGPNRLKLVREFVRGGGSLAMIGGYATFTGRHNAGNYGGTPIEEVLPVNCLERNDDRVETPEGALAQIVEPDHPILRGLDWSKQPIFNGYNRVTLKPHAQILARIGEARDPLLAVGEFGNGRALAFTSDIAPHWGAGFQDWSGAGQFLDQVVLWLAGSRRA